MVHVLSLTAAVGIQVKDLGDDFVFEDNEEGDVWGHEQRLKAQSPPGKIHCVYYADTHCHSPLTWDQLQIKPQLPQKSRMQWTLLKQTS